MLFTTQSQLKIRDWPKIANWQGSVHDHNWWFSGNWEVNCVADGEGWKQSDSDGDTRQQTVGEVRLVTLGNIQNKSVHILFGFEEQTKLQIVCGVH